ncbi:GNAT family N-acetyltransferase [Actinospica robiniae]|uniref:GNAT family N-acetyltransferase n=1 Tax=Actinospica robiniae TaxID=304901 RepID=UPI0003FFBE2C|nr:GNAT family N-acetyltransferase [Actinospica robiniae]
MEFAPFDSSTATDADYAAIAEMRARMHAVDRVGSPLPTLASTLELMTKKDAAALASRNFWLARDDSGRLVGFGMVSFPEQENTETAFVSLEVDLGRRREGIGTAFLKAVLPAVQAAGRTRIMAMNVTTGGSDGSDGERFAVALGSVCTLPGLMQTLEVPSVDRTLWDVPAPDGYRLQSWSGPAPEELMPSYTVARNAIADKPAQDSDWEEMEWTPERIREDEASFAAAGQDYRIAIAVHEATGEVAGFTEIVVRPSAPDLAQQIDTAVLKEHRGHGLGRAIKAEMMRRLMAERPEIKQVATTTAADNSYMIAVNHSIGYTDARGLAHFEVSVDDLVARLGN